jgi:hypothetical protein
LLLAISPLSPMNAFIIIGEKIGVFLKYQSYDPIFCIVWKNARFGRKYFKIKTSVPGPRDLKLFWVTIGSRLCVVCRGERVRCTSKREREREREKEGRVINLHLTDLSWGNWI